MHRSWFFLIFAFIALSLFYPALANDLHKTSLPESARISQRIYGLPGLKNVGYVAPGVFRGAEPEQAGYETLKKMGIRTVINLRSSHSEKDVVEKTGMRSFEFPMITTGYPDFKKIDAIVDLLADPANQPVFIHCRQGKDRTGLLIACYRMKIDKWPCERAIEEMEGFGFSNLWFELKKFVRDYPGKLKESGK